MAYLPPRSSMARLSVPVPAVWLQPTTGADLVQVTLQAGTLYFHERPGQPGLDGEPQEIILVPDDQTSQLCRYRVPAYAVDEYLRQNDGRSLAMEIAVLRQESVLGLRPLVEGARRAILVLAVAVLFLQAAFVVVWWRTTPAVLAARRTPAVVSPAVRPASPATTPVEVAPAETAPAAEPVQATPPAKNEPGR